MADTARFLQLAQKMIADNGAAMTYVKISDGGDIDPRTGKRQVTSKEYPIYGVCVNPTAKEVQSGLFQGIKQVILVEGQSVEQASTGDIIRFEGHDYNIKEIVRIAPAGKCILYKFGVEDTGTCQD